MKNKITYRNPNQTKINFKETFKKKNDSMFYWQQKKSLKPFGVGISSYYGKYTIVIYHDEIINTYVQFSNLHFKTNIEIVTFIKKITDMYHKLGKDIYMDGIDMQEFINALHAQIGKG